MSHPLQRFGLVVAAVFALWGFAALLNALLGSYWIGLGIGLIIALIVWRAVSGRAAAIAGSVGQIFQTEPFKGFGIAVLLTLVYGLIAYSVFGPYHDILQRELLIDSRIVTTVAIVTGLLATAPLVMLYEPVGMPFKSKAVFRSAWILSLIIVGVVAYIMHEQPNRLFDLNTGKPEFMVAEEEKAIYHLDPEGCRVQGGCFSPATGEQLRPGTSEDAKRFRKESWTKQFVPEDEPVWTRTEANCVGLGTWTIPVKPGRLSGPICSPPRRQAPYGINIAIERADPSVRLTYYTVLDGVERKVIHEPGENQHVAIGDFDVLRISAEREVNVALKLEATKPPQ